MADKGIPRNGTGTKSRKVLRRLLTVEQNKIARTQMIDQIGHDNL